MVTQIGLADSGAAQQAAAAVERRGEHELLQYEASAARG